MPYLGNNLQAAFPSYTNIDDISGSFNGVLTTFALQVGGATPVPFPVNPQQCLISVNGVIQKPDSTGTSGFNLVGSNIVFASAPTGGWAFFGVVLAGADYINIGAKFPDGSENAPSMTFENGLTTGLYLAGANQLGITSNGTRRMLFDANNRATVYSAALGNITTLTDGATVTPNFNSGNNFILTLGGNRTLANPTNVASGQSGNIVIVNTGSYSLTFGNQWKFPNATVPSLTPSGVDIICYYVYSSTAIAGRIINNLS